MDTHLRQAANHLSTHDPVLAPVIAAQGVATFVPHHDYYRALGDSIIGQQLSVKAAAAIKQRFRDLFGGSFPEPTAGIRMSQLPAGICGGHSITLRPKVQGLKKP